MTGSRPTWPELPTTVREAIERQLQEPVVHSTSQSSGFSDGSADRLRALSGRRVFVKAAREGQTAQLHRREIAVLRSLPVAVPAARLIGSFDEGDWVVLILDDVAGTHARGGDIEPVLSALASLPMAADLSTLHGLSLPAAASGLGWEQPPVVAGLEALIEPARLAAEAMEGEHLVHLDLRCDNLLIGERGVTIVDWPWASRGAPWIDSLTFLLDLRRLNQGVDCEGVLANHPTFRSIAARDITAVLCALALTFFDAAQRPSDVRGLREFQRSEGEAALTWVRERTGLTAR